MNRIEGLLPLKFYYSDKRFDIFPSGLLQRHKHTEIEHTIRTMQ